jgi:hypothetical protein
MLKGLGTIEFFITCLIVFGCMILVEWLIRSLI